jgi:hypothetical protein
VFIQHPAGDGDDAPAGGIGVGLPSLLDVEFRLSPRGLRALQRCSPERLEDRGLRWAGPAEAEGGPNDNPFPGLSERHQPGTTQMSRTSSAHASIPAVGTNTSSRLPSIAGAAAAVRNRPNRIDDPRAPPAVWLSGFFIRASSDTTSASVSLPPATDIRVLAGATYRSVGQSAPRYLPSRSRNLRPGCQHVGRKSAFPREGLRCPGGEPMPSHTPGAVGGGAFTPAESDVRGCPNGPREQRVSRFIGRRRTSANQDRVRSTATNARMIVSRVHEPRTGSRLSPAVVSSRLPRALAGLA